MVDVLDRLVFDVLIVCIISVVLVILSLVLL